MFIAHLPVILLLISILSVLSAFLHRAELFVVGDLNIDILANTVSVNELLDITSQFGLVNLISRPTWIGLYSATAIDVCWSSSNYIASAGIIWVIS